MNIAIPFFGRKASDSAKPDAAEAALPQQGARAAATKLNPRRFRAFVRPAPTTYQRCLAAHLYFAERKSALD